MIVNTGEFERFWKSQEFDIDDGANDGLIYFVGKQDVLQGRLSIPEIIIFAADKVSDLGFDIDPMDCIKIIVDQAADTFEVLFKKGFAAEQADRDMLPF